MSKISDLTAQKNEQKREYEEKIKALETELEKQDERIEELDDEVWITIQPCRC